MKRRSFHLFVLSIIAGAALWAAPAEHMVRAESDAAISLGGSVRGLRAAGMVSRDSLDRVELSSTPTPSPRRRPASVRAEIQRHGAGTYMDELLLARDSSLVRWPDRLREPLTVWVQPVSDVQGWQSSFVRQARSAFIEWSATGIPVEFAFVNDSADADVHVNWRERFNEPVSGKTLWARDGRWWMVDARIVLATHHSGGDALDASAIRALALHEVGHLLGLDHTADVGSIMTPRVRVRELSDADRATVRLLYALPPGPVR
jgi:hypothetical protein